MTDVRPDALAHATPVVRARALTRVFGDRRAVDAIDVTVPAGSIFGLLGPDGAGKTTLIRMLATVLTPTEGDAEVFGASVRNAPGQVTPRIGYMSQRFCMYPDLTVAENLDFFGTVRGVAHAERKARSERLLASMGLAGFEARQAQHLSGGMKQKLMLAATLMHEPDLLLLDEPTTGVDPVSRRELWTILGELHQAGKTVIVATPYMDEAARCTDLVFLQDGVVEQRGTPAEITARVPGTLFEVGPNPRAVLAALAHHPQVRSAHLHGDVARVLWDDRDAAAAQAALTAALMASPDTAQASARSTPVDMEAAFALLAAHPTPEVAA